MFSGERVLHLSVFLYAFQAGTDVEVTWKVLEVPSDADPKVCEKDYDMDKLWSEKEKETLNCLKLNATVKACNELQENSRNKIDGCQTLKNTFHALEFKKFIRALLFQLRFKYESAHLLYVIIKFRIVKKIIQNDK